MDSMACRAGPQGGTGKDMTEKEGRVCRKFR